MNSFDKYFRILGVKSTANKATIKKAFRAKAKKLHPDVNPSSEARQQFIELDEAYDFLMDNYDRLEHLRKPKQRKARTNQREHKKTKQAWDAQSRAKSRAKAERYANMNFEEFSKTDQFKSADKLQDFWDYLQVSIMVIVVLVIPVFATLFVGLQGLILSAVFAMATVPLWAKAVTRREIYTFKRFFTTVKYIFKSKYFIQTIFLGINVILAMWLWMVTAIDPWTYLIPFEIAIILAIILHHFVLPKQKSKVVELLSVTGPVFLVNLFFVLNFAFSTGPQMEYYRYIQRFEGRRSTSFLYLENNAYSEAPGIRFFFFETRSMQSGNHIAMEMDLGLFGIPVLKDYHFFRE
ncbi:J domain-containing protein [Halocola ammonii]